MKPVPGSTTLLLIALTLSGCHAPARDPGGAGADSAAPFPPTSELAYLARYAGQYPTDAGAWQSEPLRSRMVRLLGGEYAGFLENVRTSGPVSEEGGLLYVTGNCPSSATVWGAGIVVVDPAGNRLLIKQISEAYDSIRTYADGEIAVLPAEVMTTLRNWADRPASGSGPAPKKKAKETKG